MPAPTEFTFTSDPQPHPERARHLLETHPEVRSLFGRNRISALFTAALVALQLGMSVFVAHLGWVWVVVLAYAVGAFVSHALFVMNHECAHNLIFDHTASNYALGTFNDVALAFPSAITFRRYHLLHHRYQGDYARDADIPSTGEVRVVGTSSWRKAAWLAMLGIMQSMRPLRVREVAVRDAWIVASFAVIAVTDIAVFGFLGPKALAYLMLSSFFALGLHPVGGRWLQEHLETTPGQETYSYYGPLNRVCFNVGYHNEHHDFPGVPWNRLPRLRAIGADVYDPLVSYRSWTALIGRFLTDPTLGPARRVRRDEEPQPLSR